MRCAVCGSDMMAAPARNAAPRRRLSPRRLAISEKIAFLRGDGSLVEYDATVGFDHRLQPKEIFLGGAKEGSDMAASLADAAVAISVALQHGVKARAMALSIGRLSNGEDGDQPISVLGAALDLLARYEREHAVLAGPGAEVEAALGEIAAAVNQAGLTPAANRAAPDAAEDPAK